MSSGNSPEGHRKSVTLNPTSQIRNIPFVEGDGSDGVSIKTSSTSRKGPPPLPPQPHAQSQASMSKTRKGRSEGTLVNRGLVIPTGIPDQFKQRRKSSVPFADRTPQVRFVKKNDEMGPKEHGAFSPPDLTKKPSESSRPILKKTNFPILVEGRGPVSSSSITLGSIKDINEQLEAATAYVERVVQGFSAAGREARGCIDILTFPVNTLMGIVPLDRFNTVFVVIIICIEDLLILSAKSKSGQFPTHSKKIVGLAKEVLKSLADFGSKGKALVKRAKERSSRWETLLKKKGEFHTVHRPSFAPIYANKAMPESVTIYETEVQARCDENPSLCKSGRAEFYRSEHELAVSIEFKRETFNVNVADTMAMGEDQLCVLVQYLILLAQDLVITAATRITKAQEVLKGKVFDEEFKSLRDNLKRFGTAAGFDPLASMDLKQTLNEVATHKSELENTVKHIVSYSGVMRDFMKLFIDFVKGVGIHKTERRCGCLKWVSSEMLYEKLNHLKHLDFMTQMPLDKEFLTDFGVELVPRKSDASLASNKSQSRSRLMAGDASKKAL